MYSVPVTRVPGSTASTSAIHLVDQAWVYLLSQMYWLVLLTVFLCSVFAVMTLVQNMLKVACVLVVALSVCALRVPQALLFVWRVVVAVDDYVVLIGIQLMPNVLRQNCPYGS